MTTKKGSAKNKESKSIAKVRNYFLDLIDRKDFQEEVVKIRKKYGIPEEGFMKKERHITPIPPMYGPRYPKRWENLTKEPIDQEFWVALFNDESKLGEKFQIPPSSLNIIDDYVSYNDISLVESDTPNLFMIQDYRDLGKYETLDKEINVGFPILLRISPYASQRDTLEFIKSTFESEIKPIQEKHADKASLLGKLKSRKMAARNKFVYEHKQLSYNEIKKILPQEWKGIGYSDIGKIKSLEKKRRKEV